MNETRELAKFVADLKYEQLPKEVIERAKDLILDQFGVELASSTQRWSKAAYRYARDMGGKAEAIVVNYGDKLPAASAAFVNGTFGHGFECDDSHRRAATHPGCAVIPAALAMGEREIVDGKALLLAVVVGYEVCGRIALAVSPGLSRRGHHPTCTTGAFAAAAIAAKIMGFDSEKTRHAISIAASTLGGVVEGTQTGGSLKRIFGGSAAQGGIRAALLAQNGLTGPPTILEGKYGFCNVFSDTPNLAEITQKLGQDYKIMELAYKIYCSDGYIQPVIDALVNIIKKNPLPADQVEEVVVGTNSHAASITGTIREPEDITGAHFSMPFGVALRLVKGGNGFREYTEENLKDPEVLKVAKRVQVEVDEGFERAYPRVRGCDVTVRMKGGITHRERIDDLRVLTRGELQDKFRDLAGLVLKRDRVEEIIETVMGLEKVNSIPAVGKLLVA